MEGFFDSIFFWGLVELLVGGLVGGGDLGGVQGFVDGAGAGFLSGFVVPFFVVEDFQGLLKLGDLGEDLFFLAAEHGQALRDGGVAFGAPFHEELDVLDGHAGFFEAFYDGEGFEVLVAEHADAAAGALYKGEKAFLVVVAQGGGRDI